MLVFVGEAAEAIASADVQVRDRGWIDDRLGQRAQWTGIRDAPMRPMMVVVSFVLAQGAQEMRLVPDRHAVEQFVAAGLNPPLHDRVHAGNLDTAEHDRDTGR